MWTVEAVLDRVTARLILLVLSPLLVTLAALVAQRFRKQTAWVW